MRAPCMARKPDAAGLVACALKQRATAPRPSLNTADETVRDQSAEGSTFGCWSCIGTAQHAT